MTRIPVTRIAASVLLVLAIGSCADPGEIGGPTVGGALAARIGDAEYTHADLEAETEQWASSPAFLEAVGIFDLGAPGRRSTELVAFVLSHRLVSEQAAQLGAAAGYVPAQNEVDEVLLQVEQGFGPSFAAYSAEFRQQIGRDLMYQTNLQSVSPVDLDPPPVAVNPRYGTVQLVQGGLAQVVPPTGPAPEPIDLGL